MQPEVILSTRFQSYLTADTESCPVRSFHILETTSRSHVSIYSLDGSDLCKNGGGRGPLLHCRRRRGRRFTGSCLPKRGGCDCPFPMKSKPKIPRGGRLLFDFSRIQNRDRETMCQRSCKVIVFFSAFKQVIMSVFSR